jgi:hypothetical protein
MDFWLFSPSGMIINRKIIVIRTMAIPSVFTGFELIAYTMLNKKLTINPKNIAIGSVINRASGGPSSKRPDKIKKESVKMNYLCFHFLKERGHTLPCKMAGIAKAA